MVWIVDNLLTLVQEFTQVALADPLSAVLLAIGGLITAFAAVGFGVLAVWGVIDWIVPESQSPPTRHA